MEAATLTIDQRRRVIQAVSECDSFIAKHEGRNPEIRPADVQQHLEFCVKHKEKLLAML